MRSTVREDDIGICTIVVLCVSYEGGYTEGTDIGEKVWFSGVQTNTQISSYFYLGEKEGGTLQVSCEVYDGTAGGVPLSISEKSCMSSAYANVSAVEIP